MTTRDHKDFAHEVQNADADTCSRLIDKLLGQRGLASLSPEEALARLTLITDRLKAIDPRAFAIWDNATRREEQNPGTVPAVELDIVAVYKRCAVVRAAGWGGPVIISPAQAAPPAEPKRAEQIDHKARQYPVGYKGTSPEQAATPPPVAPLTQQRATAFADEIIVTETAAGGWDVLQCFECLQRWELATVPPDEQAHARNLYGVIYRRMQQIDAAAFEEWKATPHPHGLTYHTDPRPIYAKHARRQKVSNAARSIDRMIGGDRARNRGDTHAWRWMEGISDHQ